MNNLDAVPGFVLIHVVVNYGMGSKVLHRAKEYGVRGGTIMSGKGTVNNSFLNFLSLYDERKEIVIMAADYQSADHALNGLSTDFHFEKPNHGIAFILDVFCIAGSQLCTLRVNEQERGVNKPMFLLVTAIVNRGSAEDVIEAATAAGSKGGTIINARGSGVHETSKVFNMAIEPEKELVMILAKDDVVDAIVSSIHTKLELDKPGNGIVFVQNVNRAYGIYE